MTLTKAKAKENKSLQKCKALHHRQRERLLQKRKRGNLKEISKRAHQSPEAPLRIPVLIANKVAKDHRPNGITQDGGHITVGKEVDTEKPGMRFASNKDGKGGTDGKRPFAFRAAENLNFDRIIIFRT